MQVKGGRALTVGLLLLQGCAKWLERRDTLFLLCCAHPHGVVSSAFITQAAK